MVLLETLRSDRYVALLDRLVEAAREPAVNPDDDAPVRDIASDLLDGPWKHLRSAAKAARKQPGDTELHTVRIRAKRVRYAADAVAPLLGKPARRFADAAADRRSGDAAFAAGMLAGIERASARDARDRWPKCWRSVKAARKAL